MKRENKILFIMTGLFFLAGLWSLGHGLPFHLVGDEESIIGGTLQFLNARTPLPVFNQEAFKLLYYPIALPYAILAAVVPYALGVLLFNPAVANFTELGQYLLVNLDQVWWLARLTSLIAGTLTVYIIYKLAHAIFPERKYIGFFAVLLVLTSFYHFQLSVVMRHWIFSTLLFIAALYFLFKSRFSRRRDTLWAGFFAALASGFGQIGLISSFFVGLAYLVLARKEAWLGLKNRNVWLFAGLALGGFAFFVATHPGAFASIVAGNETEALASKDIFYFLSGFKQTAIYLLHHDAIVSSLGFLGAVVLAFRKKWHLAVLFLSIIILHTLFLDTFIHNAARYQWFIVPLLALMGAYLLDQFWVYMQQSKLRSSLGLLLITTILIVPIATLFQYGKLMLQPTSEQAAFSWLSQRAATETVLIHSPAITPLQSDEFVVIQGEYGRSLSRDRSLLGVDTEIYGGHKWAYANTHFWDSANQTPAKIEEFINVYDPAYILISYSDGAEFAGIKLWYGGLGGYELAYQSSEDINGSTSHAFSDFGLFNLKLLTIKQLGQHVVIFKRQQFL